MAAEISETTQTSAPSPPPEAATSNIRFCIRCQKALHAEDFANETIKDCRTCIEYMRAWSENHRQAKRDFTLDNTIWRTHPIYDDYAACASGYAINRKTKKIIGALIQNNYVLISIRHNGDTVMIYAHRFVWECHHGIITDKTREVCHLNNIKCDNAITNLKLDTHAQNCKDAVSDGISPRINTHAQKRAIIAIDLTDGSTKEFRSMTAASKVLKINRNSIRACITGAQKTAKSKKDGKTYSFVLKPAQ